MDWPDWLQPPPWIPFRVLALLEELNQKVSTIMTVQNDINADAAAITSAVNTLAAAVVAIQTEIAQLKSDGVNTSNLDAAVQSLAGVVSQVQAIAATTAAPTTSTTAAPTTSSTAAPTTSTSGSSSATTSTS